jgi:hypothetical protein
MESTYFRLKVSYCILFLLDIDPEKTDLFLHAFNLPSIFLVFFLELSEEMVGLFLQILYH